MEKSKERKDYWRDPKVFDIFAIHETPCFWLYIVLERIKNKTDIHTRFNLNGREIFLYY